MPVWEASKEKRQRRKTDCAEAEWLNASSEPEALADSHMR